MGKKLYVGNLPFSVSSESLQTLFAQVGTVESAKVITDRDSGRSKGFGFVEMTTDDEANAAIERLNGTTFEGRAINVSEARPPAPREQRGFGNDSGFRRGGFGRNRY